MIAALSQSLSLDNLPVNWFDGAILVVLGFGIFRGRKNGMTKEIIPLFQWIVIVIAAGLGYSLLAGVYNTSCGITSKLWSALGAYFSIALVIFIIFSVIKKVLQPKLTGSGMFGSAEYYLGMISGPIRYFCMLLFALAIINAKHYTAAEVAATKAYNQRWYGGGIYSGDYVPDLHTIQDAIFKKSFTGHYFSDYLGMFLVQTGPDAPGGAPEKKSQPVIHMGN